MREGVKVGREEDEERVEEEEGSVTRLIARVVALWRAVRRC